MRSDRDRIGSRDARLFLPPLVSFLLLFYLAFLQHLEATRRHPVVSHARIIQSRSQAWQARMTLT